MSNENKSSDPGRRNPALPETRTRAPQENSFEDLLRDEADVIRQRREVAYDAKPDAPHPGRSLPTVGIALSGGGIRSATFCLGLLRGLATNSLLPRLDYLSTVSGGGFTGGMLGRLIGSIGVKRAQAALARSDSLVMWWLRRNGRYLTPAGSRDLGIAVVTYLRAWIAVHVEFAFVGVLLGVLVALPHLLQNEWGWFDATAWRGRGSAWWPLAALVWIALTPGTMLAYWIARDAPDAPAGTARRRAGPTWRDGMMFAILCAVLVWVFARDPAELSPPHTPLGGISPTMIAVIVLVGMILRYASALLRMRHAEARSSLGVARERNRLTRALRRWTLAAAFLAGIGLLDVVSWKLYDMLAHWGDQEISRWLFGGLGIGGVALAVLRAVAEPLQKMETAANASRFDWRSRLLNALGVALGLLLLVCWTTLVQWLVFEGLPWSPVDTWSEPVRALVLTAIACLWFVITARHAETANASSLHSFYRARLTRAYLSVGNPARFSSGQQRKPAADGFQAVPPDERTGETALNDIYSVTDVIGGDDLALGDYRPETKGGPIHLVNTCLNQTRDDNSDLYNADRKGCMLTASARGFEWGRHCFRPIVAGDDFGTLGRWIAISGAAAAPGAGSYTSSGWALTLFFLGVRLGYWFRKPPNGESPPRNLAGRIDAWRWRWLPKPRLLLNEMRARYGGTRQPWWYLSDGGHFENTGVYPLLRRQLDFIILADCGADERFELGDLDNLVRKARIDFGAEIEFYAGDDAVTRFGLAGSELSVLAPERLGSNTSERGVLLARIRYRDNGDGSPPKIGTLLVVKPNLHTALDADLLGYALRNPGFPQQSTGDQFFDEAQWESYQRLGFDFGSAMSDGWLARLPGWSSAAVADTTQLSRLRKPVPVAADPASRDVPFWRRSVPAAALGTTLGIGASSTLLLAAWQVIDQVRKERDQHDAQTIAAIDRAETALESMSKLPTMAGSGQIPIAVTRQVRELLTLNGAHMDAAQKSRLEAVLAGFNSLCGNTDPPATDTSSERRTLCGVILPLVSNDSRNYWLPSCRSAFPRPRDLRGCQGLQGELTVATLAASKQTEITDARASTQDVSDMPVTVPPATPADETTPLSEPGVPTVAECLARGITLYTQVYDEPSRLAVIARFRALDLADEQKRLIPPVENVVRTAEIRGSAAPTRWRKPTLIVHDARDRDCAEAFGASIDRNLLVAGTQVGIRPLPASLRSGRRVIELWLPPASIDTTPAE
jgi:hypothetical protein